MKQKMLIIGLSDIDYLKPKNYQSIPVEELFEICNKIVDRETLEELKHLFQDCNDNCIFECKSCKLHPTLSLIKQSCKLCYRPDNSGCNNPFRCSQFENNIKVEPLELVNTEILLKSLGYCDE